MTTECVGRAFQQFHNHKADVIRRSFQKVGLSLPIDGTLDHELDIKGLPELEIGNWEEDLTLPDEAACNGVLALDVSPRHTTTGAS